ncbi:MAG TPA: acyl-CoA dehydrogenase family protein [Thermomicrobiaceae bacterium]|nr:acyl-CoA dehydrogenase family protein [Thermomicrobiaceae bacterium]
MAEQATLAARGGGWLLQRPESIATPEQFDDTIIALRQLTREFVTREVLPLVERMEHGELELNVPLMQQAGELGPLGVEVPEAYGGLDLPKTVSAVIAEELAPSGGFAVTFTAHTSLATLPLVWFGSEAQKRTYLPKLASGEWIGAYALTEPGSGSDALGARARATLAPDGTHYLLNGTKQFISNSGFAQLFTIFAKVDGDKFTAFLVERDTPGLSLGEEERKMGIKSSSTRQVMLENARVPVENVLGEIGKGHRVAFNVLNVGRYKLGAAGTGGAKSALAQATRYAKERQQFGRAIASYPLIQQKLAAIAVKIYALESALYRTMGLIDAAIGDKQGYAAVKAGIEEYAIEASLLKVLGTETLDFAVDEGVQIHGGYGFLQDFPIERAYRDARVQRIFEGTNEINRMHAPGMLLRRALKGELPLVQAATRLQAELLEPSFDEPEGPWGVEEAQVANLKQLTLALAGQAAQKFGLGLEEEQEVLAALGDLLIESYAAESAVLRAEQSANPRHAEMARLAVAGALDRSAAHAAAILPHLAEDDELRVLLSVARRLTRREPRDLIAEQRQLAEQVLAAEGYPG